MVLASWQTERPLTRASEGFGWRSVELVEAPGCMTLSLTSLAEAQRTADGGLQFQRHAQRETKAIKATATWMRTALSEVPRKRVIFSVCLIQRKNSSMP